MSMMCTAVARVLWFGCTGWIVFQAAATAQPVPMAESSRTPAPAPAVDAAAATCACVPKPVLPVAMTASRSNAGWTISLDVWPFAAITEIFVRFDEQPEESTGNERGLDLMTGKPQARRWVALPDEWVTPREHTVVVRMVRLDGKVDGPYSLRFSPRDVALGDAKSWFAMMGNGGIEFAEHSDEVTWLMFTGLFSYRAALREIRYSVDDCSLRHHIVLDPLPASDRPPADPEAAAVTADTPYLTLPLTTRSACSQVVFRDGTVSRVAEVRRQPRAPAAPPPPSP